MTISTIIKSIQDIMRQDAGVDGDAQRISQLVWMIFLKIFDDKEKEWELEDEDYKSPLPSKFRWRNWAANKEGITGDELLEFIGQLFKTLKSLNVSKEDDPKGFIIKELFEDAYNYMKSGTLIRQVINKLNEVDFNKSEDRHLFNDIYEKILSDLQSAGNAGEYYTPRAVTQFIVDMVNPKLGEKVLDPACGTGGFLICSLEKMKKKAKSDEDWDTLQNNIKGIEKKPLAHLLCTTNMILHGVEVPNIRHDNSLIRPLVDYGPSDMVDVVVTNPPFGGAEEPGIESNFPSAYRTRETADLFLVLIMKLLREDGRCGIVLPEVFLSGEGIKTRIKEKLLQECNLHTIIRLPKGVFSPYTDIETNLLFFEKGKSTKEIWYFEHPLPENYKTYGKTKPIKYEEFLLEKEWWSNREKEKFKKFSWKVSIEEIKKRKFNLDIANPHREEKELLDLKKLLLKKDKLREKILKLRENLKLELEGSLKNNPLVQHFNSFDSINSFTKLKKFISELAINGKLSSQYNSDEPASNLLNRIKVRKDRLIKENKIKKEKILPELIEKDLPYLLPKGWAWTRLGDVSEYIQRGRSPEYAENDEIPVISQKCVQWSGFDIKKVRFISKQSFKKYEDIRHLQNQDILWNSTGEGTVGRLCLYDQELNPWKFAVVDSHVTIIRVFKEFILPEYVLIWLSSSYVQDNLKVSGSTNQKELSTSTIISQILPLPPLSEQKRIIEKFNRLTEICKELEISLLENEKNSELLMEAVLREAFEV